MQFTFPGTHLTIDRKYVKAMRMFLSFFKVIMSLYVMLTLNDVNAQTVGQGRVQILAPNTYSLGLYGDVPVDYSSGLPQINIPLMTFSDREINLDVSLSYHASGIKVDQEATWVGLGWALNTGGVITREIRGLPDGYKNGSFLTRTTFPYYNGNIQQNEFSNAGTLLNSAASENGTDNGADIFYYNFNGHAGKFFLDENAKAIFTKYEDIKVEFLNGDYFVITDEKGIRYEFAAYEYTANLMGSAMNYISAWYLSKITSPEGGEINFEYVNGGLTNGSYQKRCYDQVYFPMQPTTNQSFPSQYYQTCIHQETEISGIVVKKITNSAGQYIKFITSPNPRLDAESNINIGNNLLDTVILYNAQGVAVRKFRFTYSYFEANNSHKISQGAWSFLNYRLRLDTLQEVSSSGQLQSPYRFEYFGDNNPVTDDPYTLPYRLSPCQDHWGYYNNSSNTIIFPSNPVDKPYHMDDWNVALLGNGGLGSYGGNPNMGFFLNGGNREPDGEATKAGTLKKITYPTGGYTSFTFEQHEIEPNISKPLAGGLKISQIETNDGGGHTQTKSYEYYGYSGSGSQCLMIDNPYYNWYHQPYYPGSGGYQLINELIGLGVPPNLASNYTDIGRADGTSQLGLGLNASSPYVTVTERVQGNGYTVYDYTYTEDNNLIYDGLSVPGAYEGTYIKTTNTSTYPPFTYSLNDMSSCVYPFPNFLNNDWRRGHLSSKKVYSESNQLLFEENNTYDIHALKAVEGHKVAKISEWEFFYSRYYQLGGVVKLTKQVSKTYDNNGGFVETIKDFEYGSQAHKQLTESRAHTSKGDVLKTVYKYPHDFASGPSVPNVYDEMVAKHIWSPVIKTEVYKGTNFLQSQKINYDYWNNGNWTTSGTNALILPRTVESARLSSNPETRVRYHTYDNKGNVLSVSNENDVKKNYIWDYKQNYPIAEVTGGNITDIAYTSFETEEGKGNWTFYNNPFTQVSNQPNIASVNAVTGNRVYALSSSIPGITKSGLTASEEYTLTLWYMENLAKPVFSGITPVSDKVLTTRNGWRLLQIVFTGSSSLTITAPSQGGSPADCVIDELRLFPSRAQMTTYTYNPLVGMISQADPDNRFTFYEYDQFGRLTLIRDQDKNIIKKICYNYAGQPEDCGL